MSVIQNLVEQYKKQPDEAVTNWSSTVKWNNGFHAQAEVRDHTPILVDEPNWLSGSNKGANPVELLLSALGSCMSIGFIAAASTMGIQLNSLEVEVSGDLDLKVFLGLREGNSGFDEIHAHFKVDSDGEDLQIEEIISQVMKLSPVKNSLERNVHVKSTFNHNK